MKRLLNSILIPVSFLLAACPGEAPVVVDAALSDTGTIPGDEQADVPIDGVEDSGQDSPDTNSGSDAVEEPPHDSSDPPVDSQLDTMVPDAVPDTMVPDTMGPDTMVPDAVPDTPAEETDSGLTWGCVMTSDEDGDPLCVCSDPPIEGDLVDPAECSGHKVTEDVSFSCDFDPSTRICSCRTFHEGEERNEDLWVRSCKGTYLCPSIMVTDGMSCTFDESYYRCPGRRACDGVECDGAECWCTPEEEFICLTEVRHNWTPDSGPY